MPIDNLSQISQRLGSSLTRHDTDLDLLVREGEAVSSRLRNLLTSSLRSPAPAFRRPLSTEPPRQVPPDPPPRRYSPNRHHRSDLALDEDLRAFRQDFTRSHSLSDIRHQSDKGSTHRLGGTTSTPLRARRDIFNASGGQLRDISSIQPDMMDDSELYCLEVGKEPCLAGFAEQYFPIKGFVGKNATVSGSCLENKYQN